MTPLDEIFDNIIVIEEAPKILPTNSRIKTYKKASTHLETCPKASTIVYLSIPTDQKDLKFVGGVRTLGK